MNRKKILALFLALSMLLSMLPTAAFAAEEDEIKTETQTEEGTRVSFSNSTRDCKVGGTDMMLLTVEPKEEEESITFSSSDESVATAEWREDHVYVIIRALKAGTATITATAKDGTSDSVTVTVTEPEKVPDVTWEGGPLQFDAEGKISWDDLNAAVKAQVKGQTGGTYNGKTIATAIIKSVSNYYPQSPDDVWTSLNGDEYCGSDFWVDDSANTHAGQNVIDGKTTTIRLDVQVRFNTASGSKVYQGYYKMDIPVRLAGADTPVTSVTVTPTTLTLAVGQTAQLTATVIPGNATDQDITWKLVTDLSLDDLFGGLMESDTVAVGDAAKVDENGLVTAVKAGTAKIVAEAGGVTSAPCVVTVVEPPVAEVNGVQYTTLQAAITAAQDNDIVTLLADVTLTDRVSIQKSLTIKGGKADGSKPVITLTNSGNNRDQGFILGQTGNYKVTFEGLHMVAGTTGQMFIYQDGDSVSHEITVNNCEFTMADGVTTSGSVITSCNTAGHENWTGRVIFTNNTVDLLTGSMLPGLGNGSIVTGNTFIMQNDRITNRTGIMSLAPVTATATITGNTFRGANRVLAIDDSTKITPAGLTYKNNAFIDCLWAFEVNSAGAGQTGYDLAENYYEYNGTVGEARTEDGAKKTGSLGHFDEAIAADTDSVAVTSYYAQRSEDGTLSDLKIGSAIVAQVGDRYFTSLQAAITAAQSGDTVEIIKAGEYAGFIIPAGVTVKGIIGATKEESTVITSECKSNGLGYRPDKTNVPATAQATVKDLWFEGETKSALYVTATNLTVDGCKFVGMKRGIYDLCDNEATGKLTFTNNTFVNVTVPFDGYWGYTLEDSVITITDNIFEDCGYIQLWDYAQFLAWRSDKPENAKSVINAVVKDNTGDVTVLATHCNWFVESKIETDENTKVVYTRLVEIKDLPEGATVSNATPKGELVGFENHTTVTTRGGKQCFYYLPEGEYTIEINGTEYSCVVSAPKAGEAYGETMTLTVMGEDHTHSWDEGTVAVEPTCAEEGEKLFTCACGSTKTETIEKTENHTFGAWVTDTAAQVGVAGSRHRDCTVCGHRETGTIPALRPTTPPVTTTPDPAEEEEEEELTEQETPLEARPWLFTDVTEGVNWFYASVKAMYDRNLISGFSETVFGPQDCITRGQLVAILYRMEGEPEATGESLFDDVADGMYYAKAVRWAHENGVVKGLSDNIFGADEAIRRQDVAVILYRYAQYKGYARQETGNLSAFVDVDQIQRYAVEAMTWAVGAGLISGVGDNKLNPRGGATRAEACALLDRFMAWADAHEQGNEPEGQQ